MARKRAPQDVVTLVSVDNNGETLLAISLDWVVSELTTYTTILHASTVEDLKADADAFEFVSERWQFDELGDEDSDEDEDSDVDSDVDGDSEVDNRSFDAEEFFGEDYSWRPEARFDSRAWLDNVLPHLQVALEQPDTGWGMDYEPAPFIHMEHRETVENALRGLGHEVVDFLRLAEFYDDPPKNWRDQLPTGRKA